MPKEDKLWRVFSEYIRQRDADENGMVRCATCGGLFHWKDVDAGHFISRNHKATKYDEQNVQPQCRKDNRFLGGRQYEFGLYITTFSLERAKNGEPFTYDGRECKFGSIRDWVNPIGHLPIDTQEQWNKITSLIQEQ